MTNKEALLKLSPSIIVNEPGSDKPSKLITRQLAAARKCKEEGREPIGPKPTTREKLN